MIGLYFQKPLQNSQSGQRPPLIATAGHPQLLKAVPSTTTPPFHRQKSLVLFLQRQYSYRERQPWWLPGYEPIKIIQSTRPISDHYLCIVFKSKSQRSFDAYGIVLLRHPLSRSRNLVVDFVRHLHKGLLIRDSPFTCRQAPSSSDTAAHQSFTTRLDKNNITNVLTVALMLCTCLLKQVRTQNSLECCHWPHRKTLDQGIRELLRDHAFAQLCPNFFARQAGSSQHIP